MDIGYDDANEAVDVLEAISEAGEDGLVCDELVEVVCVDSIECLPAVLERVEGTIQSLGIFPSDAFTCIGNGQSAIYRRAFRIEEAIDSLHRLAE